MNLESVYQRFTVHLEMPKKFDESVIQELMKLEEQVSGNPLSFLLIGKNLDGTEKQYGISHSFQKLPDVLTSFTDKTVFELNGILKSDAPFPQDVSEQVRDNLQSIFQKYHPRIEVLDIQRKPLF